MEPVFSFDVRIDRPAPGGLVRHLHGQLRGAILDGRLAAGTQLPSSRRAAEHLGIGRNTVVAAYDLLVAEGYVRSHAGARAVIADVTTRRGLPRTPGAGRDPRINPLWTTPLLQPESPRALPARCFRLGVPDHRLFPHALWRQLAARALRQWSKTPFGYPPSAGLPELRAAIAAHVAFARAVACAPEDIVVTSGAQQAFDLLARILVVPGQTCVAIENPGYPPLRAPFHAAGARLVPVPVDDEGLCVDALPHDTRIVCVTPSHQSPTGVALSMRRRAALLEFARTHDAVIVEDDYDGEFRFGGRPLDALQTLDRDARVFYVGTFSKSLFPALRKGFVVAPAWARDAVVAAKHCADAHSDETAQMTLAAFIRDGHLARHVRRLRPVYAARRDALLAGLVEELGEWLEPIPSEAGLHLAARLRDPTDAPRVVDAMRRHAPGAQPVADYAFADVPPALVFGYGVIDAEAIGPALAAMRRALRRRGGKA
jgi:GntR family transcriptional regulator/MocR family aminotransferase